MMYMLLTELIISLAAECFQIPPWAGDSPPVHLFFSRYNLFIYLFVDGIWICSLVEYLKYCIRTIQSNNK
jgi:hypothetical protein